MNSQPSPLPCARRDNIVVQSVGDEVLVLDKTNDSAHALNGPAAFVWQQADGMRTIEQIAANMSREFGATADAQVVWYALDQLGKRNLLRENINIPDGAQAINRRQFLKRAVVGAVLLAVVTSIVAPPPAFAQSGSCFTGTDC